MNWIPILLQGFFVAYFVLLVILATISFSNVNSDKSDESDADKVHYDKARTYLAWCVGIGWLIVGLGIILLIVAIAVGVFFSPEEAAAAAFAEGGSLAWTGLEGEEAIALAKKGMGKFNEYQKAIDEQRAAESGLLGYSYIFGGSVTVNGKFHFLTLIQKILLWITLIALLVFGVLAAIAATAIGQTSDKKGYTAAVWTAVLGIIPFSIILIWTIADWIYVSKKKKEVQEIKKQVQTKPRPEPRPEPVAPPPATQPTKKTRRGGPPPPPPPSKAPPPKAPPPKSQSAVQTASNYYNQLTPEQKEQLKNAGSKLLGSALDYFSS